MNVWQEKNIAEKIVDILKNIMYKTETHHLGNPFLTSYQLAIEFKNLYPSIVELLPYHSKIGGAKSGIKNSLSQYLGNQISKHYDEMKKLGIEGGFLSNKHIIKLEFQNEVASSVPDISMFRYNPNLINKNIEN